MKILICNERFLFRFGVDRVLLILGSYWKKAGHEIIMMGNKLDEQAVNKCSDRFIYVPESTDYFNGNEFTEKYISKHWDEWFCDDDKPDIAFIAGWPFYKSIKLLKEKCGCAIFQDHGAVPLDGMGDGVLLTQQKLQNLRKENLRFANKVIAVSNFLETSQSIPDVESLTKTSFVYNGINHLDLNLWKSDEIKDAENENDGKSLLSDLQDLKKNGYKLIFQPGRWETGNYKNCEAGFKIIPLLKENGLKVKILVLSTKEKMGQIPSGLEDSYYPLGYVDDNTMRNVMEICDLGLSPTLWEGFDLPLGEMQYLGKRMFVFDVGAHPEVVAHRYFLCKTNEEMSKKICDEFSGKSPVSQEEWQNAVSVFKEKFTWKKSADELFSQIKYVIENSGVVFIDVTNACHDSANSGVMRVTRKTSRYVQNKTNTVFVLWDNSISKYVFPYPAEVGTLCSYGGPDAKKIQFRSIEGQSRTTLEDVIKQYKYVKKYLLLTETVNYLNLQHIIPYIRTYDFQIGCIFYDAIPAIRPDLIDKNVAENHIIYMSELSNCDVIMPIAEHNGQDLKEFWKKNKINGTKIASVPLACEIDNAPRSTKLVSDVPRKKKILFVSTLEPRKNHIRFLKAFGLLMEHHPELQKTVSLTLVGNRYVDNKEIPDFVEAFCKEHSNAEWLGVVDDTALTRLYSTCTFTAYPSEIEGFGMPIMESLWFGKPCLCNNAGSIGELGSVGGCAQCDVLNVEEIEKTLHKLITDSQYYIELQHQAAKRKIVSWSEYAGGILKALFVAEKTEKKVSHFSVQSRKMLSEYLKNFDLEKTAEKVIYCANFYPPNFIGGAELIAHYQARTLVQEHKIPVVAVSLDVTGKYGENFCYTENYDGVLVLRICVSGSIFDVSGINFFDKYINSVFEELCQIFPPTVVHAHNIIGMSLGILDIAKKVGAKTCVTLHDFWGFCYKNTCLDNCSNLCEQFFNCENCMPVLTGGGISIPMSVRKSYFNKALSLVDDFISPSQYLANRYVKAGFNFHKMNVVWNGIDSQKFDSIKKQKTPSDKIRITFCGCFGKHKGIDLLIKAVAQLKNKNIEINLAGSGAELENYKTLAFDLGLSNQIVFWGKVDNKDIQKVFAQTDIYCLPSIWPENQPVSITEAMASGIPVIASNLGGSKELVKDGVNGFLFEANDVCDLAKKIQIYIEDNLLLEKMGKAGKEIICKHTFSNQVKKLLELYARKSEDVPTKSKKIIAVKGFNIPQCFCDISERTVLPLDWLLLEQDIDCIEICVILSGQKLDKKELQRLQKRNILFLVKKEDGEWWKKIKGRVLLYENDLALCRILAEK